MILDPLMLSQNLIKYPSVTPDNVGTIDYLCDLLEQLGFKCQKLIFHDEIHAAPVHNLYARFGNKGSNFCFAGHTDVVAAGDLSKWSVDPFAGVVLDQKLYGRGAVDMKSAIACFIAAFAEFGHKHTPNNLQNSISLLISGDEEQHATNGIPKVLATLAKQSEQIDYCLIGEPSNPNFLGEMIKIGRRGSVNGILEIYGTQGHVAYPEYAHNPIKDLVRSFQALTIPALDHGNEYFQPSNLEFTSIDIGNKVCNMIPDQLTAKFNIRFNNHYSLAQIIKEVKHRLDQINIRYNLTTDLGSEPFINLPIEFCDNLTKIIQKQLNCKPLLGTAGGTSDARFIQSWCPVVEFGLIAKTAHQIDEHVAIDDLYKLTEIYQEIILQHMYQ